MNKKRILLLGGSYFQVPSVLAAKEMGYHVITCDYVPENPGHQYADEYYNISTTNKELVLELAEKLKIDGIVAYASDPAAPTAAYVAEKLKLPGNPYQSVKILAEKDLYRVFLSQNGFNLPKSMGFDTLVDVLLEIDDFSFPVMIKPVDSSGSKGVCKISSDSELVSAFEYAMSFSRVKRIVIEEYLVKKGPQIHGDAFVFEGKLFFSYLGDHHYDEKVNPFVPYSTTLPSVHSSDIMSRIESELQRLFNLLDIKHGAFNIEVRIDEDDRIFLMEIGPRNGGNLVPQLEEYASGFNMVNATLGAAMGEKISVNTICKKGFFAYYVLHSDRDGILKEIKIAPELYENILEKHIFKNTGDSVQSFQGSNASIGVLLFQFSSMDEMIETIDNSAKYIQIELESEEIRLVSKINTHRLAI
ncbi:ATP-grasp domain-containing protein [Labilibaculum antarcticum]|uniref:Carbamoyl-phosphate-synthetase n=1 Tax=Labilibaculum antarcticum TaxID=1717717 RepID=A0A1Y1CHY6_9BACT|nr:ATP-grasp domain-containing protein [Labilibaculum antarcticum]BAX78901.1 carbamoyl-phosphate-synthetase [Labilibaculum antarcticum]